MSTSRPLWLPLAMVVAVALMVAGLVAASVVGPRSFGWFAYQPSPADAPLPVVLFPEQVVALATALIGALLLSLLVGYRVGRRHPAGPARGE